MDGVHLCRLLFSAFIRLSKLKLNGTLLVYIFCFVFKRTAINLKGASMCAKRHA